MGQALQEAQARHRWVARVPEIQVTVRAVRPKHAKVASNKKRRNAQIRTRVIRGVAGSRGRQFPTNQFEGFCVTSTAANGEKGN